jgi:predicted Zn-dependent peptidase
MHASFEESELKQFIARKKQEFLVNSEKVDFIARQHFTSLLFGKNHPYGKYTTLNDFDAISSQALIDFHDKYYLSGSCRIYVAGHFGEKELALLEANLGSLKNNLNSNEITLNWEKLPSVTKMHKLEKAGAVQNALRLGLVSIHRNHPDYFAVKVLVTILGGYFGSRLMTNIREDKGFTYGIGAGISSFRQESVFFISTEVNSEVVEAAQNEIYAEIRKLQQELVSDDELDTVRNYLLGNIQRSFDGTFSQLDRYKEIDLHNADYTYYTNYIAAVENIDAVSLLEAAKKYLDIDKLYFLNVGS